MVGRESFENITDFVEEMVRLAKHHPTCSMALLATLFFVCATPRIGRLGVFYGNGQMNPYHDDPK